MGNLTVALVFVLSLNVLMFLSQAAIIDINEDGTIFYNCEGTILQNFDKNNCEGTPILDTETTTSDLPTVESTVQTTGNIFTDTFSSVKAWFAKKTGIAYLYSIVSAPYNILKSMQLPDAFTYAIGTLWYGITFFLIVAFFWGRE